MIAILLHWSVVSWTVTQVVQHWLAGILAVGLLVLWLLVEEVMLVELLAAGIPMAAVALKPLIELLAAG